MFTDWSLSLTPGERLSEADCRGQQIPYKPVNHLYLNAAFIFAESILHPPSFPQSLLYIRLIRLDQYFLLFPIISQSPLPHFAMPPCRIVIRC